MRNNIPLLTPVSVRKLVSRVPSVFKRAIFPLAVPLYVVKKPQISIFPSGWIATLDTSSFIPTPVARKPVSSDPFVLRRVIHSLESQLYCVKLPQIIIFPSVCNAIDTIGPFAAKRLAKFVSSFPLE